MLKQLAIKTGASSVPARAQLGSDGIKLVVGDGVKTIAQLPDLIVRQANNGVHFVNALDANFLVGMRNFNVPKHNQYFAKIKVKRSAAGAHDLIPVLGTEWLKVNAALQGLANIGVGVAILSERVFLADGNSQVVDKIMQGYKTSVHTVINGKQRVWDGKVNINLVAYRGYAAAVVAVEVELGLSIVWDLT